MTSTFRVALGTLCAGGLLISASAIYAQHPTQPAMAPVYRQGATVTLRKPGLKAVATATKPVTPFDRFRGPFLPKTLGCFHFVGNAWKATPCATAAYIKAHYIPPPVLANSIQSTPYVDPLQGGGQPPTLTNQFVWGSVAVTQTGNLATATEKSVLGSSSTPNAFSIQTNTNTFLCKPCKSGSPFAATSGVLNSASQKGDTGWVQFVYQQFKSGSSGNSRLCVWNVDVTIANNTNNVAGYASKCVYPSATYPMAPLVGSGAPTGAGEVIGYVQCPNANSNAGCTLWVVGQIPWAKGSGWWSVSAKDSMGLAGNWTNVGGTMLGPGGGAEAVFTKTSVQQVVRGYTCYEGQGGNRGGKASPGKTPKTCTAPPSWDREGLAFALQASPATYNPTAESNNLSNGAITSSCAYFTCWISYGSSHP